ncbi:hypothetical protein AB6A40_003995 [Gnathostoma spinigerum]|uniref:Ion transport domain-containing protein n=1 Tax=Gnathostoma spinigerum TaxID=75299 RepID=A0ABD6ECA2_9BILA
MIYIVVLLVVALLAFGLARQSITYPDEDWHWMLVRNIFYKPYFMLYGEVYADEIDACGDDAWDNHLKYGVSISALNKSSDAGTCVPGHWIPPLMMTAFLLIANILLMSMLLATFNNIFVETDLMSKEIWLFQRYGQVMEYESTPFLPPPFTVIYHLWMLLRYARIKICNRSKKGAASLWKAKVFDFSLSKISPSICVKYYSVNIAWKS